MFLNQITSTHINYLTQQLLIDRRFCMILDSLIKTIMVRSNLTRFVTGIVLSQASTESNSITRKLLSSTRLKRTYNIHFI